MGFRCFMMIERDIAWHKYEGFSASFCNIVLRCRISALKVPPVMCNSWVGTIIDSLLSVSECYAMEPKTEPRKAWKMLKQKLKLGARSVFEDEKLSYGQPHIGKITLNPD